MKVKLLLSIMLIISAWGNVSAQKKNMFAPPKKGTMVKAQKIVTTEHGHKSIGILIPDRGMADPHVWIENETLYAMCGHDKTWEPVNTWIMDRWELWSTKDLVNWKYEYSIQPTDTYIGNLPNCWAGDLCERDGKYYWFFSNRNLNSGVMVADKITGPYRDLLGKPLLTPQTAKTKPYDPEIFIENGEYYIVFGASTYFISKLNKDMKSLKTKAEPITVLDEKGKHKPMGDKPAMFKRGEWYYLMSGNKYAMSKNLYGPYKFKGSFGVGAHNSFFQWKGQWYYIHETTDTNFFFRGIGLQPLYFNEDGTMHIAKTHADHPGTGRDYNFSASQMGWHVEQDGTTLHWNKKGYIEGQTTQKEAAISSASFVMSSLSYNNVLKFKLRNESNSNSVRITLASYDSARFPWKDYPLKSDWKKHTSVEVKVKPNSKKWIEYTIDMNSFKEKKESLMQIRIEPTFGAIEGKWAIDDIIIKKQ